MTAFVGIPLAVILGVAATFAEPFPLAGRIVLLAGGGLMLWLLATFSRLTVSVGDVITVAFGRGWPRRLIDPATVKSARAIRTSWYYGWGIRFISRGTLWNVWGLDAVELVLDSGRRFWFGTDEPEAVLAAVQSVL